MSQPTRDLWPKEFAPPTQVSPVAILREQAELLGEKTGGVVEGEVTTAAIPPISPLSRKNSFIYLSSIGEAHEVPKGNAPNEPTLVHSFYVQVPALDNYRFLLLTVLHGNRFYPLSMSYTITNDNVRADSEDEFLHWLGEFLSRGDTILLIQSLMAQVATVSKS